MPIHQLKYFYEVAKHCHFTNAAKELHMSQPPLTRRIQQLEETLGVVLLNRSKRTVTLTPAGEYLFEACTRLFKILEHDIENVKKIGKGEKGTITIGFTGSVVNDLLPKILKQARITYPDLHIHVSQLTTAQQIKSLNDGSIDLGLLVSPIDEKNIATRLIRTEPFVACIPKTHPFVLKDILTIDMFKNELFIMTPKESGSGYYNAFMNLCSKGGFYPKIVQTAQEQNTIVSLVAAQIGVAFVPESTRQFQHDEIIYRSLAESIYKETSIAWNTQLEHHNRHLMLRFIEEYFIDIKKI